MLSARGSIITTNLQNTTKLIDRIEEDERVLLLMLRSDEINIERYERIQQALDKARHELINVLNCHRVTTIS